MKYILILIIFSLINFCKEEKPNFHKEYTEVNAPVEGILPYFKGEILDPYWIEKNIYPEDLRKLPSFTFTTQDNKSLKNSDLLNKYKLLIFFYARCNSVCPMITSNIKTLLPKIKNQTDLEIVSISINPEVDTPTVLKSYTTSYKISQSNWMFLTGSKEIIYDMARKQFAADVKIVKGEENLNDFVHTENVFLIDKKNYLRGIYRAKGTGDLERLLVELETLRTADSK